MESAIIKDALFIHYPWDDSEKVRADILTEKKGPHIFFRRVKTNIQARFAQLVDHNALPQVFLLGSPHCDNYAKTNTGCGMIDFDRAHRGPYQWDLMCLVISMSLRQKNSLADFIPKSVSAALLTGYLQGATHPGEPYQVYAALDSKRPKKWQQSVGAYITSEKKWAKKLAQCPIPVPDPLINELINQYYSHRDESALLANVKILAAARTVGSFGRIHNLIHVHDGVDEKLLDIKHVRHYANPRWTHTGFYHNDFQHEGQRMIAASKLLAPGVTANESYATVNGIEYWAREVPTQNEKLPKRLSQSELEELAYAVGTQIGRGHALSVYDISTQALTDHLQQHFDTLLVAAKQIHAEIFSGWRYYHAVCEFAAANRAA